MAKMFSSARGLVCSVCAAGLCLSLSASLARAQNLLADPGFKAVIETAFSAIAHGRAHDQ